MVLEQCWELAGSLADGIRVAELGSSVDSFAYWDEVEGLAGRGVVGMADDKPVD